MDEAAIAAKLAEKTNPQPIPPPVTEEPEPPEEPKDENFHHNLPLENTIEKLNLMDYFQIPSMNRHSPEVAQWLDTVIEWARDEAGSSEYTDMLRVINDQERVMGNRIKPDRLLRLWQFVKIHSQRKRLIEQERSLYG